MAITASTSGTLELSDVREGSIQRSKDGTIHCKMIIAVVFNQDTTRDIQVVFKPSANSTIASVWTDAEAQAALADALGSGG